MRKSTVDEVFDTLRHDTDGKFFSVTFERRTTRKDGTAIAGEMRTMLCRTAATMTSYKKGIISDAQRDEEDQRCGIITVWSMDAYMTQRRQGDDHNTAAWGAWRRIDIMGLRHPQAACSLIDDDELPITYRPFLHEVKNPFRSENMPKVSQARS